MSLFTPETAKYIKYFILFYCSVLFLSLIFWGLGVSSPVFEMAIGRFGVLGLVILLLSWKKDELSLDLKRVGKDKLPVFIVAGFCLSAFFSWCRHIVLNYGVSISPGARQVRAPDTDIGSIDTILIGVVAVVIGPALEEIIFRFIGIGIMPKIIMSLQQLTQKHYSIFMFFWVIIVSSAFSLLHGPDRLSFPVYFFSSIVFSSIYIKYGLLASTLVHSSCNMASILYNYISLQ